MKNRTAKKVGTGILAGALVFGGLATSLPGYASAAENKVMAAGQGTISDVMFEDLNGNSVQDANETTGVAGIKVELYSDQGVQVGTVTTGTDGRYTFSNLADGTYYIHVDMSTLPANEKLFTTQGINGSDGNSSYFTITNGNTVTGYHFGFYPQQGAIQSYIYNDANGNGQKDGGEAGISNVHVALYNESGAKVADATTDGSGAYGFTALTPGRYYAKADIPANYQYKSSTYYGSDGTTGYFTVGSEQTLRNELNLGVATLNNSAVSGTITDASTGSGIANVTVELRDIQGNVVATQKTDGSGRYNFASLSSGDYYTRVTIPADYAYASGTGFGSDGNSNYIHLTGDNTASNYAMSLKKQANASVSGVVNTTDGSGLGNQNVSLYSVDGTLIKTITTAADGTFQFVSLPAGNYYVKAPIPAGYTFESSNGFGSDGNSYYLQVGASDAINGLRLTVNQQVGQIRSTVFSDANKNGTQESAETGVAGVTVSLYNTSGAVVATATTDNNGLYTFENVKPGYYYEKVTTPSGYTFLANSSFGSDGVSGYIQVQANQTRTDLNASLVAQDNPAEVSSAQWIYNKDGSKPAVNNGSILTISNDYYDSYSNKNINVQFYNKAGETVSTTGYTVAFSNPDLVKPVYSNSKLLAFTHSEKTGSTLVTVSDSEGKVVRTFTIVVTGSEVQATGIDLETTNIDATVGDTGKIAATVQPANATNKTLSYTPADASVISVDANGNWTALKAGTTTIAVKTTDGSNITKTVTVVVKDNPAEVSSAQWIYNKDGSKPAVNNGSILTISNDYYDSYSNKNINVQFYNKAGETVSTTGYTVAFSNPDLVKPVYSNSKLLAFTHSEKTGSTLVTVSDSEGKVVRTFTIVVTGSEVQATGIDLETTNIDATVGDTGKIAATVQPANATNKTLSYTPADASVISVDANGNWTALKAGTTTIAVKTTDGSNITKTVNVTVKAADVKATDISLSTTNISAIVGNQGKVNATVAPSNATNQALTYTPADASVISVDANGNWTALKAGTTTIAVKTTDGSNITKTINVTVTNPVDVWDAIGNVDLAIYQNDGIGYHLGAILKETTPVGVTYYWTRANTTAQLPMASTVTGQAGEVVRAKDAATSTSQLSGNPFYLDVYAVYNGVTKLVKEDISNKDLPTYFNQ